MPILFQRGTVWGSSPTFDIVVSVSQIHFHTACAHFLVVLRQLRQTPTPQGPELFPHWLYIRKFRHNCMPTYFQRGTVWGPNPNFVIDVSVSQIRFHTACSRFSGFLAHLIQVPTPQDPGLFPYWLDIRDFFRLCANPFQGRRPLGLESHFWHRQFDVADPFPHHMCSIFCSSSPA